MGRAEIECRLTNQSLAPVHTFFCYILSGLHFCIWDIFYNLPWFFKLNLISERIEKRTGCFAVHFEEIINEIK